jgi:hypothetical protein
MGPMRLGLSYGRLFLGAYSRLVTYNSLLTVLGVVVSLRLPPSSCVATRAFHSALFAVHRLYFGTGGYDGIARLVDRDFVLLCSPRSQWLGPQEVP